MFLEFFDTSKIRLLYADTDSLFYSIGEENLDDLVKEDKKTEWLNVVKPLWFAMPKEDPRENAIQQRKPGNIVNKISSIIWLGLLKHEFVMTKGSAVCVCPKTYSLLNYETDESKTGLKGISKKTLQVNHDTLLQTIYEKKTTMSNSRRFKMNKKKSVMELIQIDKRAVNPVYTKLYLQEDSVTISPLFYCSENEKILV